MPPASAQHRADEEFTSFADELARNPDVEGLLLRLRHGHNPDRHGWCDHPSHTYRWDATRARASVWPIWSTSERGHLTQHTKLGDRPIRPNADDAIAHTQPELQMVLRIPLPHPRAARASAALDMA